jgi:hypothetical protein
MERGGRIPVTSAAKELSHLLTVETVQKSLECAATTGSRRQWSTWMRLS